MSPVRRRTVPASARDKKKARAVSCLWLIALLLASACRSGQTTATSRLQPSVSTPAQPQTSAPQAPHGPSTAEHGVDVSSLTTTVKGPKRLRPKGEHAPPRVALGTRGAVSSAEAHASEIALGILKRGGNAVDAAIALAFALAVTQPSAGNIGGGGFMVVRMNNGRSTAIDYREKAPSGAHRNMYLDAQGKPTSESLIGPKAAGIPGTVAGMALAHSRFGSLTWKELLKPAVQLARRGHKLDTFHADDLSYGAARMLAAGFAASARHYQKSDGSAYQPGELWRQPQLATTLERIATSGASAFYQGELAERMASEVQKAGGIWKVKDLADYRAIERTPIRFDYRGHQFITMPPPSAGGIVLRQILGASELLNLKQWPWHSPDEVHLYVEASRRDYADRNNLLGDPDFIKMPLSRLLDPVYIGERMGDIDRRRATPSKHVGPGIRSHQESEETTHYSVIDGAGNAVANTYTLNTGFGSKYVIPGVGVLLNNEMDDFSVKPGAANVYGLVQNEQNRIEPHKRMLSSMTPTIIVKDGAVRAVLGSPGGPTITTTVAQLSRALIDYDMTLDAAVQAPRIHHQWLPDAIRVENEVSPSLIRALQARKHVVKTRGNIGHANCIEVDPETKGFRAVADVARDGGKAISY